ncbi:MAG: hypothetical protein COT91_01825 [Candidatus Doudnabacteria bacterium CG10_big_fil_rev_8_21_14_0_10_41_10]|uniref:PEGA domain-containing protein n=1 Tax=Candidatus Doudnabacteria bacterium CG10_big_fil_rev_8_21_14_0_10_41_10 TaxID=1974551 RepID=A0A2H0VE52_9BACT|nr:MAG: hypothetical protein COT91_01825 [Candidatus Doudnabacteria bacterium CG10_big_fil_rev_8_21_14_0_10_41_10]
MKFKRRVAILIVLFIIFIVVAPTILFFALGYTFDFELKRFIPTGTLTVFSDPRGATLSINGDEHWKKTPLRKRYLKPGEYEIKIQKEGYTPWVKLVKIFPQIVTTVPGPGQKINLFFNNPTATLVSTSSAELLEMEAIDNHLTATSTLAFEKLAKERNLFSETLMNSLPTYTKIKVAIGQSGQIFALLDNNLYDLTTNSLFLVDNNITDIVWDENAQILLYFNRNNILIYQPEISQRNQLITRSSKDIEQVQVNKPSGHVFYLESGKIKAVEIKNDMGRSIVEIVSLDEPVEKFLVDKDGRKIYYFIHNQGLFSAQIR